MAQLWYIHTDGGARGNPGQSAVGVYVVTRDGEVVHQIQQCIGVATNNEAEYEAFWVSLNWVLSLEKQSLPQEIIWKLDSLLVVEQLNKRWKIKEERLRQRAQEIWKLLATLSSTFSITHIPRKDNSQADRLVNQALDAQ